MRSSRKSKTTAVRRRPPAKRYATRFDNLTDEELVEQFGQATEAKAAHNALRKEVLRREIEYAVGGNFVVVVEEKTSVLFDYDRCREWLGNDAFQSLWTPTRTTWVMALRKLGETDPEK